MSFGSGKLGGLLNSPPAHWATLAFLVVRRRDALAPFRQAVRQSALKRSLQDRPSLWGLVLTPFVSTGWDARRRVEVVARHYAIAQQLGRPFDVKKNTFFELLSLEPYLTAARVTLDAPIWFARDGLLTLSLWIGVDRVLSLSFAFSDDDGVTVAYVGGIQAGQRESVELYRMLTKQAEGMRPRDLIITLFRTICQSANVKRILAVSDACRHQRSEYSMRRSGGVDPVNTNYDLIWVERQGILQADGFFELPLVDVRRADNEIPARKRAMYRRRYDMLDCLIDRLTEKLNSATEVSPQSH